VNFVVALLNFHAPYETIIPYVLVGVAASVAVFGALVAFRQRWAWLPMLGLAIVIAFVETSLCMFSVFKMRYPLDFWLALGTVFLGAITVISPLHGSKRRPVDQSLDNNP
jgi:hypothetical protein